MWFQGTEPVFGTQDSHPSSDASVKKFWNNILLYKNSYYCFEIRFVLKVFVELEIPTVF